MTEGAIESVVFRYVKGCFGPGASGSGGSCALNNLNWIGAKMQNKRMNRRENGLLTRASVVALATATLVAPQMAFAQETEQGDEIIVTGSRIAQPNLTSTSPLTLVQPEDLKLQGVTRVEDILNTLPSVFASQASTLSNGADGTATVDLRGLGTSRTLTLVNGRRLIPGDPSPASGSAADVNMIPGAILKRVEILTGGASSTYGADAVAGVVNFIVDTEFEGFRVDGQYAFYQHNNNNEFLRPFLNARGFPFPDGSVTDGDSFDATVMFGTRFGDDRGHLMAYAGYRKIDPITQGNRDYSACTLQNTGAGANRCGGSATAPEGNVLVFDTDVTSGTSTFYTFQPGGGFVNGSTAIFNFAPLNYFQRPDERYTAGFFANYEVNDWIKPYAEFQFMDNETVAQIAPSGNFANTQVVNCDNPLMSAAQFAVICDSDNLINGFLGTFPLAQSAAFNPNPGAAPITFFDALGTTYNLGFAQILRRNTEGGPRRSNLGHTTFRAVIGSKGDLGEAWSYDTYFQFSEVNYSQVYENEFSIVRLNRALNAVTDTRVGSPTFGQVICRSLLDNSDPNCVPYNVFAGIGGASQAAVDYLSATGFQSGETRESVFNASVSGDLTNYGVKFPSANDGVRVNFGVEWRKEALQLLTDQAFQTGDLTGQGAPTLPAEGDFEVLEFFGEAQIPVINDGFVHELSFNAGYRRSDYDTSGANSFGTDTFKIGAELAPIPDIRLRGTYNRAVRAPNIQELFSTPYVGLSGSNDPCAGIVITATDYGCIAQGLSVGGGTPANPAGQYNGLLGGNPNLQPETAKTWTVGGVIQPSAIPGLALTIDYYNIKIDDSINGFGADAILLDCVANATATFTPTSCGLVTRNVAGSIWLTADGFVDNIPGNVGSVQTKGLEFTGSYGHDIGKYGSLSASFNGTRLLAYEVDNGLTAPYDCAGFYGPTCSVGGTTNSGAPLPEWRHRARLTYETPFDLSLSAQWRYVGSVAAETTSGNPTLAGANLFDPGLEIGSQSYFDLVAIYSLKDSYTMRLGVNNLLDREPPLVTSGNALRPGSNLCPTGPCNGNTYPATYDALGRYLFLNVTLDF